MPPTDPMTPPTNREKLATLLELCENPGQTTGGGVTLADTRRIHEAVRCFPILIRAVMKALGARCHTCNDARFIRREQPCVACAWKREVEAELEGL